MNSRLALLAGGIVASVLAGATIAAESSKADPVKGQAAAATVCAACHGADGNSVIPANPKLAGQIPEYIEKQLHDFQAAAGQQPARVNVIMNGMAAALSADDIRNIAAYYSQQKLKPEMAKDADLVALGRKIFRAGITDKGVPACAGCHGANGEGIPKQYPHLAGQFAEYTEEQLKLFRSGERANDPSKMMTITAGRLSDREIHAVADYIAGLR